MAEDKILIVNGKIRSDLKLNPRATNELVDDYKIVQISQLDDEKYKQLYYLKNNEIRPLAELANRDMVFLMKSTFHNNTYIDVCGGDVDVWGIFEGFLRNLCRITGAVEFKSSGDEAKNQKISEGKESSVSGGAEVSLYGSANASQEKEAQNIKETEQKQSFSSHGKRVAQKVYDKKDLEKLLKEYDFNIKQLPSVVGDIISEFEEHERIGKRTEEFKMEEFYSGKEMDIEKQIRNIEFGIKLLKLKLPKIGGKIERVVKINKNKEYKKERSRFFRIEYPG